ncbi:MAG TPA: histidine kinase [Solirubrobacteraceae bacterium]|nr:histidine kinase [Solirubrobacteraceae bacterium]
MNAEFDAATPAEARWVASQRRWAHGWRRYVIPGVFLLYLLYVIPSVSKNQHGASAVVGYAILGIFAVVFLDFIREGLDGERWRFWLLYGVLFALFLAELPLARDAAFVLCLYITAVSVAGLGARSVPIVAALALAALLVPAVIPSWHTTVGNALGTVTPVAIPVVAIATFGTRRVFEGNRALAEARAELARLSAENERIRIARDLHDLLGHSLTTITVKAGLARQLGEIDPARAVQEISEVETLARRSLSDVRAAVTSYRDVTLLGELATGRELLRAAGIAADLPRAVDVVDPSHQELFGWAVREGLTNVVRHARASACAIHLSPDAIEIVDDGVGGPAANGNGLEGLRERVGALGGVVDAGPLEPKGWRLRVSLEPGVLAS